MRTVPTVPQWRYFTPCFINIFLIGLCGKLVPVASPCGSSLRFLCDLIGRPGVWLLTKTCNGCLLPLSLTSNRGGIQQDPAVAALCWLLGYGAPRAQRSARYTTLLQLLVFWGFNKQDVWLRCYRHKIPSAFRPNGMRLRGRCAALPLPHEMAQNDLKIILQVGAISIIIASQSPPAHIFFPPVFLFSSLVQL